MEIHNQNNLELLKDYFKVLNKREKEFTKDLGISRSYVSLIKKRALTKMLCEYKK